MEDDNRSDQIAGDQPASEAPPQGSGEENTGMRKELEQLKESLKAKETEKGSLDAEIVQTKGKVSELQKAVDEVDKTVDAYKKLLESTKKNRDLITKFYSDKNEGVQAVIGEQKDDVDDVLKEKKGELDALEKSRNALHEQLSQAEKDYSEAQPKYEGKKKLYDDLRSIESKIGENITQLNELMAMITKEEQTRNNCAMYFLLQEMDPILECTKGMIKDVDEYKSNLDKVREEMDAEYDSMRNKAQQVNEIKEKLRLKQSELDTFMKKRRGETLKAIKERLPNCGVMGG